MPTCNLLSRRSVPFLICIGFAYGVCGTAGCQLSGRDGLSPSSSSPAASSIVQEQAAGPADVVVDDGRRSTSGSAAVKNLNATLDGALGHYERTGAAASRVRAFDLLSLRASMLGAYDDFFVMEQLASVPSGPSDSPWLRIQLLITLHRFTEAAQILNEQQPDLRASRYGQQAAFTLAVATHEQLADQRFIAQQVAQAQPNHDTLAALALVEAALGQFTSADLHFREALDAYRDSSPFLIAWNHFQRGVMWAEAANRPDLARPLYEAAVRRLPDYAVANVHLAELEAEAGALEQAIARLESLVDIVDPEPAGLLAELLLQRAAPGDAERAEALILAATERYDTLLQHFPAAFADHGAEFFSSVGGQPERALRLALDNLSLRSTPRAYLVAMAAAEAAGAQQQRCALHEAAQDKAYDHPVLQATLAEHAAACAP